MVGKKKQSSTSSTRGVNGRGGPHRRLICIRERGAPSERPFTRRQIARRRGVTLDAVSFRACVFPTWQRYFVQYSELRGALEEPK
jgi:hypothetical protein